MMEREKNNRNNKYNKITIITAIIHHTHTHLIMQYLVSQS